VPSLQLSSLLLQPLERGESCRWIKLDGTSRKWVLPAGWTGAAVIGCALRTVLLLY
jgi:hypothetical protein